MLPFLDSCLKLIGIQMIHSRTNKLLVEFFLSVSRGSFGRNGDLSWMFTQLHLPCPTAVVSLAVPVSLILLAGWQLAADVLLALRGRPRSAHLVEEQEWQILYLV